MHDIRLGMTSRFRSRDTADEGGGGAMHRRPQTRKEIESELSYCFSVNLLVVQNFISIYFTGTLKAQRWAAILLTFAHCQATHYPQQIYTKNYFIECSIVFQELEIQRASSKLICCYRAEQNRTTLRLSSNKIAQYQDLLNRNFRIL